MDRILIVEDDEKIRKELNIFLSNNGYEVKFLEKFVFRYIKALY